MSLDAGWGRQSGPRCAVLHILDASSSSTETVGWSQGRDNSGRVRASKVTGDAQTSIPMCIHTRTCGPHLKQEDQAHTRRKPGSAGRGVSQRLHTEACRH